MRHPYRLVAVLIATLALGAGAVGCDEGSDADGSGADTAVADTSTDDDTAVADTDTSAPQDTACLPDCAGLACGPDGCGGVCGNCDVGETCDNGQCFCTPACDGRSCGPDGCGGVCGSCAGDELCSAAGSCEPLTNTASCPPTGPFGQEEGDTLADLTLTDCDGNPYTVHGLCAKKASYMFTYAGW